MGNHYHLLIETTKVNLSVFMHTVQSGYTVYFNRKRNRSGHLFQGRFKSLLVDKDAYLLELSRYIHLNPVRARITERPEGYRYSSYHAYCTPSEETFVFRDLILGMAHGAAHYRLFVESALSEELRDPFKNTYGGMILGRKSFIKDTLKSLKDTHRQEVSSRRMLKDTAEIEDILSLVSRHFTVSREAVLTTFPYRNYAVYLVKKHTPLSNPEIGAYFGSITYSAVTKIMGRLRLRMEKDHALTKNITRLERELSTVKG
jgi:putative transposase